MKTVSRVNEVKGDRIFGGCPSMPAGRVSIVKYAGNCKTTTLEPVDTRENLINKLLSVFTNDGRQLVFVCVIDRFRL